MASKKSTQSTSTAAKFPVGNARNVEQKFDTDEKAYVEIVKQYDWKKLCRLWQQIKDRKGDLVDEFKPGKALEYLMLRAFESEGATVTYPYGLALGHTKGETEQIDGAIHVDGVHAVIESKDEQKTSDTTGRINVEPIAKLRSQLLRRPSFTVGIMVSTNGFTDAAKVLTMYMMPQTILLWEGEDLDYVFCEDASNSDEHRMRAGLRRKLHYAVETGMPDFSLNQDGES